MDDLERESAPEVERDGTYEAYCQAGGVLNREKWQSAVDILRQGSHGQPRLETQMQVKGMKGSARQQLSPEQESIYYFLRKQMPSRGEQSEGGAKKAGKEPWQLYDHELMAEVLLITGGDVDAYKNKYPNIFPRHRESDRD